MKTPWIRGLLLCGLVAAPMASAFKLQPFATDNESRIRYLQSSRFSNFMDSRTGEVVSHFSVPVHEDITHRIYGCDLGPAEDCSAPLPKGRFAPWPVLFGVQWNDNPPFQTSGIAGCPDGTTIRLPNFSECWIKIFKDAEDKSRNGDIFDEESGHALLYRVHFGDLQFLHSMASWDGESAKDTRDMVLAWAELTYNVATNRIPTSTKLANAGIVDIEIAFDTKGWTVESLFTLGQDGTLRKSIPDIAFGSLLHMVEDSFAKGHVQRDEATAGACPAHPELRKPGDVLEFHSYPHQSKSRHGKADSREFLEAQLLGSDPNVVQVGRTLLQMRNDNAPWATVRQYLQDCVYFVPTLRLRHPAGPGADFEE